MPRFPDGARVRLGRRASRGPPMGSQGPGAGKARTATALPPRLPTVGGARPWAPPGADPARFPPPRRQRGARRERSFRCANQLLLVQSSTIHLTE